MWDGFKEIIFQALLYLHGLTGDFGAAIIILTVGMRVVLMPLTIKQTKSMYELQRIQPKIKELQQKHKKDKERLQAETLKFYEENKVNPFGGCLPLLLQMPIFLALFQVLGGTHERPGRLLAFLAENAGVSKAFWVLLPDITKAPNAVWSSQGWVAAIPYLVIAALFALSVWLPQQLGPGDKQQKQIALYMAVMMAYFGWVSPAGVLIYWVTSSAWQLAQQAVTTRTMKKAEEAG